MHFSAVFSSELFVCGHVCAAPWGLISRKTQPLDCKNEWKSMQSAQRDIKINLCVCVFSFFCSMLEFYALFDTLVIVSYTVVCNIFHKYLCTH